MHFDIVNHESTAYETMKMASSVLFTGLSHRSPPVHSFLPTSQRDRTLHMNWIKSGRCRKGDYDRTRHVKPLMIEMVKNFFRFAVVIFVLDCLDLKEQVVLYIIFTNTSSFVFQDHRKSKTQELCASRKFPKRVLNTRFFSSTQQYLTTFFFLTVVECSYDRQNISVVQRASVVCVVFLLAE